jgi:hypothetical protein
MGAAVGTTALVLACSVGTDCDFGLCAGTPAGGDAAGGEDTGADVAVKPPDGCDDKAEPKGAPLCVVSEFGIFVSPSGKADGSGKKDDPVNTITAALAKTGGIRRVYVCEGSFDERVVLKSAISLYGGFKCSDWSYSGTKSVVGKATETGYALDVQSVVGAFEIADLEFVATNGTDASPNSIAARFVGTSGAVLRRMKLTARDGAGGSGGATGALGSTVKHTDLAGTPNYSPDGNPGVLASAGQEKGCKCPNATAAADVTTGGAGSLTSASGGQAGTPALPPSGGDDGVGGAVSAANCGLGGGTGHNGAPRIQANGGIVATKLGTLEADTWKASGGALGATGLPGQGGGGGTGQTGGGSGGACGGCGGFGGAGGSGGGASVAMLAIGSPIRFSGELATGKGGRGGDGGDGGDGGGGGIGGVHPVANGNGCNGGDGGKGGKGGDGSGGAGGLSVGVLSSGPPPITEGVTFTLGSFGDGGTGKSTNSGPKGVKANMATVEALSTKTTL